MLAWLFPVWCCVFTFLMCEAGQFAARIPLLLGMLDRPVLAFWIVAFLAAPIAAGLIALRRRFA